MNISIQKNKLNLYQSLFEFTPLFNPCEVKKVDVIKTVFNNDIYDVIERILLIPDLVNDYSKAVEKSIAQKAERIVNGIYDISNDLIDDLDCNPTPYGTLSLELEKEDEEENEIYLHIEIGLTKINWQFRVNGKRLDQEEGIIFKLENYCDNLFSDLKELDRGIKLYLEH